MNEHDSTETVRLLEQVSAGHHEAFDDLFARHQEELRQAVVLRLDQKLHTRVDASDVVQETQMQAFRRFDEYLAGRPMPFRFWLRKTAHECLIKFREHHIKAMKRSVDREIHLPDHTSMQLVRRLCAVDSSPSQKAVKREMVRRVRQMLAKLSDNDREILLMRYVEGLSNQEIGYILELHPDTVSRRHGRALLHLAQLMRENGIQKSDLK